MRQGEAHGSGRVVVGWGGGERGKVHSENGGLILGADGSLRLLGIHQPCGAALGLRVALLLGDVALPTQRHTG